MVGFARFLSWKFQEPFLFANSDILKIQFDLSYEPLTPDETQEFINHKQKEEELFIKVKRQRKQ